MTERIVVISFSTCHTSFATTLDWKQAYFSELVQYSESKEFLLDYFWLFYTLTLVILFLFLWIHSFYEQLVIMKQLILVLHFLLQYRWQIFILHFSPESDLMADLFVLNFFTAHAQKRLSCLYHDILCHLHMHKYT